MVRYKNRYFVSEFSFAQESARNVVSKKSILKMVEMQIQQTHGDFGVGCVSYGLDIKYLNPLTQTVIIRVRHGPHRLVGSVLPLIKWPVQVRTLACKATILKAYLFLRNHQIKSLEEFWKASGGDPSKLKEDELKLLRALKDFDFFNRIKNTSD